MVDKKVEALIAILRAEKVFLPGSAQYNASLSSYFSPQAAAVHPACFVAPQSVIDASAVITSLTSCNSHESHDFAVRAGGHTWFSGANSAPGGITIDLRGLNSIKLSADKSTVSVGSGATWDAVYSQLEREGLSVAGGCVAGVGVGGLALGGGISYFGPREECGPAVGAPGRVKQLRDRDSVQPQDLRTGLALVDILKLSPLTEVDNQAKIYGEIMAAENYDVNASFLTGWVFASQHGVSATLNQLMYTRLAEGETPAFYKPILELPAISNICTTATVANMSTIAQSAVALQKPQAARYMTATTTFVPTEDMIRATYEAFNASLPLVQGVAGIMWAIYKRGGADNYALGLSEHHGSLAVGLVSPSWSDASEDEVVYDAARSLMADIENRAKKLGVYNQYIYLGYTAPWQEVIKGYGEKNVKKLQELRKRVDPRMVFTNMVRGGFKIPEEGH